MRRQNKDKMTRVHEYTLSKFNIKVTRCNAYAIISRRRQRYAEIYSVSCFRYIRSHVYHKKITNNNNNNKNHYNS